MEILSTHFVDLWLNKHQIRQKIHPTVLDRVYPRGRNRTLRPFSFPWESFPFLDLRSVGLSDFAPLSNLASLGQTNALLCQTTRPTSLRSRKVKLSRGKKNWSSFPFCPRDTLCLAVGTIILGYYCRFRQLPHPPHFDKISILPPLYVISLLRVPYSRY